MHLRARLGLGVLLAVVTAASGQTIYTATPNWISTDVSGVGTGGALVDLDHDGWLDFVVANGNDMAEQHIAVYYNNGAGAFPTTPNWQSADFVYNGHLDVADVNGDGWTDVAVATLGEFSTQGPIARVYLNNSGTLSSLPDWSANIVGNAFGCAFGDMNNDGRPDLAVATGWAYGTPNQQHNYVYLNVDGMLAATPSWTSADTWDYQGACWVDGNNDGWLDLAYAAGNTKSRVYRNLGGMLETTASWNENDVATQDAIMVTAGDINADGRQDLVFADNNQIAGGSGTFRQYNGSIFGMFGLTAAWTYTEGYCSAVALADVNSDGALDLATGAWWDYARVFLNTGTGLPAAHSWRSNVTSVIEKICFGDIEKNGLRPVTTVYTSVPAGRRLFYLPYRQIQDVTAVMLDGQPLLPSQYMLNHENGWLTVGQDVATDLYVQYTVSSKLDMAITNWDSSIGNYVYYNQIVVMGDANCDGTLNFADINPFVMLFTGTYEEHYPDCDADTFCDMNGDGTIDFGDINPFVAALVGS